MRILVISDSHRNVGIIEKIVTCQPDAQHIFFLGDHTADIEDLQYEFSDRIFHIVRGNCDLFSAYPSCAVEIVAGKKVFYTHGHTLGVKYGIDELISSAKSKQADIALYGHTHVSQTLYDDGLYIVNPGSCAEPRSSGPSYAVIDITPAGIMPIIVEL